MSYSLMYLEKVNQIQWILKDLIVEAGYENL